jgi:hypothetical protein
MKKNIIILFIAVLFLSCFEQTVTISSDRLNGKISYKVKYNKEFENFISYSSTRQNIDLNTSVLFDRIKLKQIIDKDYAINLTYYNLTEKDNAKICEVEINFDKAENLPKELPALYFPTTIYESNQIVYCQTIISLKKIIDYTLLVLTPDEQNTLNNYISLIKFTFIYKTPKNIIKANRGRLLQDRKTLVYDVYLSEILKLKEDIEILLSYR